MRVLIAAVAVLSLIVAGCSQPSQDMAGPASAPESLPTAVSKPRVAEPKGNEAAEPAAAPVVVPMLAYAYSYRLQLPADQTRALLARHQASCEAAGPALCQIVSAKSSSDGADGTWGELELRAQPAWLKTFRDRLGKDAAEADGKVIRQETEAEDLTRSIVDTEAAVRAQQALQTRLERLLVERPGNLADALAIEQELARVRGNLDATRSGLEVMKGRVATSRLTISYVTRERSLSDRGASPVLAALAGFLDTVQIVAAALINLVAVLLLPALIAVPAIWWLLRRRRRLRANKAPGSGADR